MPQLETIAAIATPLVTSAVGMIRLSGERAFSVAAGLFSPKDGSNFENVPVRMMVYGDFRVDGRLMDKIVAVRYAAPHSYTGEDCVELFFHGGVFLLTEALHALVQNGARPAQPGEFTKRAFLNGKTDLSAAEAVGDILAASSGQGLFNAAGQLAGRLAETLGGIRGRGVEIAADFAAWIDFVDEGVEPPDMAAHIGELKTLADKLKALADSYKEGVVVKEGVRCAVIGRPNVGKSSLLNALLGYSRSIVTEIPGTTRDVVEAEARIGGVALKIADTAGIRETADLVESLGVERSREAAESAGLILIVVDGSRELTGEDHAVLALGQPEKTIVVQNKADLGSAEQDTGGFPAVRLSARTGEGIKDLESTISTLFFKGALHFDGGVLTNARHAGAVLRAGDAFLAAAETLEGGFTPDIAAVDLSVGLMALGEITGEDASAEIINDIFARFCVGK